VLGHTNLYIFIHKYCIYINCEEYFKYTSVDTHNMVQMEGFQIISRPMNHINVVLVTTQFIE